MRQKKELDRLEKAGVTRSIMDTATQATILELIFKQAQGEMGCIENPGALNHMQFLSQVRVFEVVMFEKNI